MDKFKFFKDKIKKNYFTGTNLKKFEYDKNGNICFINILIEKSTNKIDSSRWVLQCLGGLMGFGTLGTWFTEGLTPRLKFRVFI